jgi:BirA family biotin operon repressor/biotin-[acetyl-CoA-carboxylase] ligase
MTRRLDAEALQSALPKSPISWRVLVFDELASTNDSVSAMARDGAEEGVVIFAESQSAGRGRFGRSWSSDPGESLAFSILLRPRLAAEDWPRLATAAAVGVAAGIDAIVPGAARIKWPNDILLQEKKVAGILIETGEDAAGNRFAVVGIGLNVNQTSFPDTLEDRAISLRQVTGTPLEREHVAAEVLAGFAEVYGGIGNFAPIRDRAEQCSALIGRSITAHDANGNALTGVAEGLDANGALLLRTADGKMVALASGEVTLSAPSFCLRG